MHFHFFFIIDIIEEVKKPSLIVHYDHTEEKGRVFGPSHVSLNANTEEQRLKNIAELKGMSIETEKNRKKCKLINKKQQLIHRERLNRLRARKGLSPLPPLSSSEDEEEPKVVFFSLNFYFKYFRLIWMIFHYQIVQKQNQFLNKKQGMALKENGIVVKLVMKDGLKRNEIIEMMNLSHHLFIINKFFFPLKNIKN